MRKSPDEAKFVLKINQEKVGLHGNADAFPNQGEKENRNKKA